MEAMALLKLTGMAMPRITKSELKQALIAAEKARPQEQLFPGFANGPKVINAKRSAAELLASSFSEAGIDLRKIDKARRQHRAELDKAAEKHRADIVRRSRALKEARRAKADAKRYALEQLASIPLPHAPPFYVILPKPFLIWSTPHSIISDSNIAPWDSWAKTKFVRDEWGNEKISFYFLWENPSDYHAVIDLFGSLTCNGYCRAEAEAGIFVSGMANLTISAGLTLWQWWKQPATPVNGLGQNILYLSASGGAFSDDVKSKNVLAYPDLDYFSFIVPPHELVVVEVYLYVYYEIYNDAYVHVDFETQNLDIDCPFLMISLLTAPPP
jgi:hypothetical protein